MKKINRLRQEMRCRGLDAVLVFDELNQRYLSDFAFTDGLLLIGLDKAYLITDFRYYEMALSSADKSFEVVMPSERVKFIGGVFSELSVKTVGFEGGFVSYQRYTGLCESYPECELVNIGDMIELLRQVKTPEEIEKMQRAQNIADAAFSHILKTLTPNMTEIDVAVELEYAMRRGGAEGFAFDTVAVSGDASALPHGSPRNERLHAGFLTMDFGAKFDGYCSDMTRTVVIGKADEAMRRLYDTTLRAQLAALDFIRAGCDAGEADKVARDIIDAYPEFRGAFGHSLGHSVGLFVHEMPAMSPRAFGRRLRAGEIVTVEPGIYLFGKYGCRIEDMVCVENGGVRNFAASAKEMIEIY